MNPIKYHPLVDRDVTGEEKIPMFFSNDQKTVAENHDFYLEEIIPHYFRLIARSAQEREGYSAYRIHCPDCGHIMQAITRCVDEHRLALYACPRCGQTTKP